MSVVLLILKIIGITLLILLLLVLALITLVLFVPVRYMGSIVKGTDKTDFMVTFKASWLLHFVNFLIRYTDKLYYRVRITIITIFSSDKKCKEKKTKTKKVKTVMNDENGDTTDNKIEKYSIIEESSSQLNSVLQEETPEENIYIEEDNSEEETNSKEKKSIITSIIMVIDRISDYILKIIDFLGKVIDFILNIPDSIESAVDKIVEIFEDLINNCDFYLKVYEDERNRNAIALCINEVGLILKNIKPSKVKGFIHFGFEDPYQTGQIMSICGMLYPIYGRNIDIFGEFDKEILEINLDIKGRVTIFVLLRTAFKLYFSKDLRRLKRILSREGK